MPKPPASPMRPARWLSALVDARPGEWGLLLLAFGFHFVLFVAYYMLRPLRSEIQAHHADVQAALYTGTFVTVLIVVPLYSILIANRPRRVFLPVVYLFFAGNLVIFWWVFRHGSGNLLKWTEWTYFVWVSAFNLFAVSIFWGFMADIFRPEQAKRMFGAVAAGASVGGIAGASFTAANIESLQRANLVLLAGSLLALCAMFVWPLDRLARRRRSDADLTAHEPAGNARCPKCGYSLRGHATVSGSVRCPECGSTSMLPAPLPRRSVLAGLLAVARSPYLLGICGFILLFTLSNTFLDLTRAQFVSATIADRDERTEFFAWQETAVNAATLVVQLFIVGRIMRWLGVATALAGLPILSMLGFATLGLLLLPLIGTVAGSATADASVTLIDDPGVRRALIALVVFEVVQRMARYALARPSREVLFTVVSRDVKYQAKPFIDTVVYRGGDVASAWSYSLLYKSLGLSLAAICFAAVPIAGVGVGVAFWLGRRQARMAGDSVSSLAPVKLDPGAPT